MRVRTLPKKFLGGVLETKKSQNQINSVGRQRGANK